MALTSSNVTSGFIDLATFDEIEKYMYGDPTQPHILYVKHVNQRGLRKCQWSLVVHPAHPHLIKTGR